MKRRRYFYTLDVLTNGSEHTGHGTIFLSVWKQPQNVLASNNKKDVDDDDGNEHNAKWLKENMDNNMLPPPTARYAISGLGDCLARLCADQRMKLSPTRAVFMPTNNNNDDGLAALLLALHSAGSSSLHVVSPDTDYMEEMMEIVLGKKQNLKVATCQVPEVSSSSSQGGRESPSSSSSSKNNWWKVYEDEFLQVHASRISTATGVGNDNNVAFLYTLPQNEEEEEDDDDDNTKHLTIAVVPALRRMTPHQAYQDLKKGGLPLVDDDDNSAPVKIDYFIALDPIDGDNHGNGSIANSVAGDFDVGGRKGGNLVKVFMTKPQLSSPTTADPGLLMRAQQVARYFHDNTPDGVFPFGGCNDDLKQGSEQISGDASPVRVLKSGTTIVLGNSWGDNCNSTSNKNRYSVLDRRIAVKDPKKVAEEWSKSLALIQNFITRPSSATCIADDDENEIDLDDLDDDDDDDNDDKGDNKDSSDDIMPDDSANLSPRLVVLGTGCASPSATRGASGYAIVFPKKAAQDEADADILIVDAGEGVTTMLSRNLPPNWTDKVVGIWISHAHLDHYGGLPNLVRTIRNMKKQNEADMILVGDNNNDNKRRKLSSTTAPWIIAPPKVLRFLDLSLKCRNGSHLASREQFFLPRVHQDPTLPPGPWQHFESINVYHNCCPAYGLLLGWKSNCDHRTGSSRNHNSSQQMKWFCFSGDTRPCPRLVNVICRQRRDPKEVLFLLHEATFEDTEKDQAAKKKHSTVSEAMRVAVDVRAHRVLLTHFSQRYVAMNDSTSLDEWGIPAAFAVDGFWVPIKE